MAPRTRDDDDLGLTRPDPVRKVVTAALEFIDSTRPDAEPLVKLELLHGVMGDLRARLNGHGPDGTS